jgi:RNA binding exosome subunit
MDLFVSGSGIYLRFDRQEFVQGRLKLLQQSPVRIKIFTPVYRKVDLQSTYRELLESLRRDG